MKTFYIYLTTNTKNNKEYIGAHESINSNQYLGSGIILKRAITKYGVETFDNLIIGRFRSREIMYWIEKMLVDEEYVSRADTYNLKVGGKGGWTNASEMGKKGATIRDEKMKCWSASKIKKTFSRNTTGNKNPNAKVINIANEKGEIIYECFGNFKKTCIDNGLPFKALKISYQNESGGIFMTNRPLNLRKDRVKFKGWSAFEMRTVT